MRISEKTRLLRKRLTTFLMLFVVASMAAISLDAQAEIHDLNAAINKAGRQRMLSQRMAKAYLQVGQKIDAQHSRQILDDSMVMFDEQLVELKKYAPSAEIKQTFANLEVLWQSYKVALTGQDPNREGAPKVLELSDKVLQLSHEGTLQLVGLSKTPGATLVSTAGRQRMLSQRMAKLFHAIHWGVAPANSAGELGKARGEFAEGMKTLSGAAGVTPAIKAELELAQQQWMFFDNAMHAKDTDKAVQAKSVASTSERLLEEMDRLTTLFEKLEAKK